MMLALRHNFDQSKCQRRAVNPAFHSECGQWLTVIIHSVTTRKGSLAPIVALSGSMVCLSVLKTGPLPAIIGKIEVVHLLRPLELLSLPVCFSQLPHSELSHMPSQVSALPLPVQLLYSWPSGSLWLFQFGPLLGHVIYTVCTLMWPLFFLGGQISQYFLARSQ